MTYEMIENKIEALNEEITRLNNEIVELTWIDKDFNKPEVKALDKKIQNLMNQKYELQQLVK